MEKTAPILSLGKGLDKEILLSSLV